ncbi:MAG: CHASE2 domain-containing protein [Candidatus Riflebacteria bacterium]|nr:CHASE2 domain-containing protein [Candidatus Riflebacteria bacterium]
MNISALRKTFITLWETHTGLVLAFVIAMLMAGLFVSDKFSKIDDYLTTIVYQIGYRNNEMSAKKQYVERPAKNHIFIIKKDEATSSLLGENPGRREFASILRLLGRSRRVPIFGGGIRMQGLGEIRLGWFSGETKGALESGLLGLKTKLATPSLSFFRASETLNRIPDFMDFPSDSMASPNQLLSAGASFSRCLTYLSLKWTIKVFPKPNILLSVTPSAQVELPKDYPVNRAGVIVLDFPLDGPQDEETDAKLESSLASSDAPIIIPVQSDSSFGNELLTDGGETSDADSDAGGKENAATAPRGIFPEARFLKPNVHLSFTGFGQQQKEFVRCIPLYRLFANHDRLLPSTSLLAAVLHLDQTASESLRGTFLPALQKELDRILPIVKNGGQPRELILPDRTIPLDQNGCMEVYFFGSSRPTAGDLSVFHSATFMECFDDETLAYHATRNPERKEAFDPSVVHRTTLSQTTSFAGRLCMAGPFERSDFDYFPTPMSVSSLYRTQSDDLNGIEIHANAALTILENHFIIPPSALQTLFLLFLTMLSLGLFLERLQWYLGLFTTILFFSFSCWIGYYSFHSMGRIFLFGPLFAGLPLTWLSHTLISEIRKRRQANINKKMFSRCLAPAIVDYILQYPDRVKPGGTRTDLTIFFSTLVDFSSVSRALSPEDTVVMLNEYLGAMTDILWLHGGLLDKFIGEYVMAFWNFPLEQKDHPVRACLCAIDMQKKLRELQDAWAARGLPRLISRCGINSASIIVAYMGSGTNQMNLTCMGDGINLASRLTGANKAYGTRMMISENTNKLVQERVTTRFLDFLAVKGKKEPVRVYEIICEKGKEPPEWNEVASIYDAAVKLQLDRNWDKAIEFFESVLARIPEDGPSRTYLKRCYEYKENPPPENWDGSYHLTQK